MTESHTTRVKKSYSLSAESALFIHRVRKARKIASDSQALEQILLEVQETERLAEISAAYRAYYDQANEQELLEEQGWAELGEQTLTALTV